MEDGITTAENISFRERNAQAVAKDKAKEASNLSTMEKAAFGLASVLAGVVLAALVLLTIVGFIFSPITDTLIFGLLAAATGVTSYVIWRGGRCVKNGS
jgi:pilus assembly protein TadC